jgi:hypothetical protein
MIMPNQNHICQKGSANHPPWVNINNGGALDGKTAMPQPLNVVNHKLYLPITLSTML